MTKANLRHNCAAFHPSPVTDLDLGVDFPDLKHIWHILSLFTQLAPSKFYLKEAMSLLINSNLSNASKISGKPNKQIP